MSYHVSVRLEVVLLSVQDRCTVCAKRTIGLETILDALMVLLGDEAKVETHFDPFGDCANLMGLGVVPDLLVSVDKLDLGWIRRWLSDYNDHKVAAP